MSQGPCLINVHTSKEMPVVFGHVPRVGVLMSTYNGEHYLREQVETIAAQDGVEVELFVRDDGSTDGTRDLLANLSARPNGCISSWHVEYGENIGFLASFERLLMGGSGCDYYAFSDQDDYWLPEKLSRAIASMRGTGAGLYASVVEIADEGLNPVGSNDFPGLRYTVPAELIRHRLAGHTMVWGDGLQKRIRGFGTLPVWSHDQHVVLAGLLAGTNIAFDGASYVLHRRLVSSVTPGGAGLAKRVRHELGMLWNPRHVWDRAALAKVLLSLDGVCLAEDDRRFLAECANHKRVALVNDSAFDCGLTIGNAEARVSVLLGRF
jgi:glycosyltransferase involved in cell wall biosynthesis